MIIPNVSSWWATGVSCSLQPLLKKQKECTVAPLDGGHGEIAEIQGAVTAIFENVSRRLPKKNSLAQARFYGHTYTALI